MAFVIAKNKSANFNYEIYEKFECGIVLFGWEVKSLRAKKINLSNSFASFKKHELFLVNAHISLYMSVKGEETRSRKLLMHKNQLLRISLKQKQQGYTLIPLDIYFNNKNKIKLTLALAKGKNKADKRESEKKQQAKKELKQYY
ncbi:SsrA-binding protein [Mesomycoplasma neurolyticum]|uniref:SsrA-binding protein n=1 Tax=Mesomycoplasma neurolyticum TaxID=2120 RepID=A0A449A4K2_9BACT|nr:SsrA-binding protein [Mesomycoplasma neurolyticum]VEU59152.1 SsrA-binding protein [Mesomycoplasma neurolyticum]